MKEELIEQVLQASNLTRACEDVVRNKGAGGVDRMNVKELKSWLDQNRQQLVEQVRNCEYHAQPIRGKEISKGVGKTRLLGIPTVVDRMLQQAVQRVIMFQYEVAFSNYSFGFRPKRNTIQATGKSLNYINSGYQHIVDPDIGFVRFYVIKPTKSIIGTSTRSITRYSYNCCIGKLNAKRPCV
jgi:retron-type reverse transcriptase